MRLVVLGGSAAGVNTGAGCTGYLVEFGDTRVVVDLGPDTLLELRKHTDIRSLSAIVISHWHLDHVLDLGALRYTLEYNPIPTHRRIPLYLPPGAMESLALYAQAFASGEDPLTFFSSVFEVSEYDPDSIFNVDSLRFSFRETRHYVRCWAIRVSTGIPSQDLTFSADTGPAVDLTEFARGSAVFVAESTLREPGPESFESRGHLTATETGQLAKRAGVGRLVVTHNWEELDIDRGVADAAAAYGGQVDAARPGFEIRW